MKKLLTEKNMVVVLFILVIVAFSFAQKDTRHMEEMYLKASPSAAASVDHMPMQQLVEPSAVSR